MQEERDPRYPEYEPDRFKITFDNKVGRIGVAKEDIEIGKCILVDNPIACRGRIGLQQYCDQCLVGILWDPIPSPLDTSVR